MLYTLLEHKILLISIYFYIFHVNILQLHQLQSDISRVWCVKQFGKIWRRTVPNIFPVMIFFKATWPKLRDRNQYKYLNVRVHPVRLLSRFNTKNTCSSMFIQLSKSCIRILFLLSFPWAFMLSHALSSWGPVFLINRLVIWQCLLFYHHGSSDSI